MIEFWGSPDQITKTGGGKGVQYLAPEACRFGTPLPTVNGYDKIRSGQTTQTRPSKGSHKKKFGHRPKMVETRSGQVHGKVNARSRRGEGKVERQGQGTRRLKQSNHNHNHNNNSMGL